MSRHDRVLVVDPRGNESVVSVAKAQELIADGSADYRGERACAGSRRKLSCVVMKTAWTWVKDRGVRGGRLGLPYEPNGHQAQFTLVRQ